VVLRLAGMGLRIWLANALGGAGMGLYQLVLDVASGKQTCAEKKGFREISIFKDGVVL